MKSLAGTKYLGYTIDTQGRRYDYFWGNGEILEESSATVICVGYEPTHSDAKRWMASVCA